MKLKSSGNLADDVLRRLNKWGLFYDHPGEGKKTVILASMARSGSTFVNNLINHKNNYRVIFEPFHPENVKEFRDIKHPLYLREEKNYPHYSRLIARVLSGKLNNSWVNRENRQFFPTNRLIKSIRVNFFLKWLKHHHPNIKIILLFRNPCAVVNSWSKMDFGQGKKVFERMKAQPEFMSDYGSFMKHLDQYNDSLFNRLVFFWGYFYWVPLQQFNSDEIYPVFYENFFLNLEQEIQSLFQFLEEDYDWKKVEKKIAWPASTTKEKGDIKDQKFLYSWKNNYQQKDVAKAFEILSLFGLENLYNLENSIPNRNELDRLLDLQ